MNRLQGLTAVVRAKKELDESEIRPVLISTISATKRQGKFRIPSPLENTGATQSHQLTGQCH